MARKSQEAATATPRDVIAKWDAEGAPVERRIARAASSLAWYRRALKGDGLKPATRRRYREQERLYKTLVSALRAGRDAARAKGAAS